MRARFSPDAPVTTQSNPEFDALFEGMLFSLLSWEQLAEFWQRLDPAAGWYLYAVGETPPPAASDAAHVSAFVAEIDALLRKEHHEDYCGIVYADNLTRPRIVKIYDPNHLGTSCGSGKHKILPGWVMCTVPPSNLSPSHVVPLNRKRWWQGFMDLVGAR
jgi:hypothetical protein